jgi:hypothetical protein
MINIYLSNFNSLDNSSTVSCDPTIPKMCSGFEFCYPICSSGVRLFGYSGFLRFNLRVCFLCSG